MKGAVAVPEWGRKIAAALLKYKYVLLVVLAGVLLLLMPGLGSGKGVKSEKTPAETEFSLVALEKKLEDALSQVEGAGRVTVVLTAKEGTRNILAEDKTDTESDTNLESRQDVVVVSSGSGTQEAVLVQQIYPQLQGALLVCPGGGEATVRLKLTESVAALTDLGADKIAICKRK